MEKLKVYLNSLKDYLEGPPCEQACPVHTKSGFYVRKIAEGDYKTSFEIAKAPNPFVSVCARVCAAPCEDNCRRKLVDSSVTIRALKWFVCNRYENESQEKEEFQQRYPERIAVVGGGPSGVACAEELAKLGYRVTIFESGERLGGTLWKYIPPFRLPRDVIDSDLRRLEGLGVEVLTSTPLTKDFGISQLKEKGYRAIFIAVGTNQGVELPIEGRDGEWVLNAVDFLYAIHQALRFDVSGKRVVVVGGGFVALDAARTALRSGAQDVTIVYRRTMEEMPIMRTQQGREEMEMALKEGIKLITRALPRRIITKDKKVVGVEIGEVERLFNEKGEYEPVFKEGSIRTLDADIVIMAIGQRADLSFIKPEDGIEITERGIIKVDPETLQTTAEGVFAGGDVAFGPGVIIRAVADGIRAARSIHKYLRGEGLKEEYGAFIENLDPNTLKKSGYESFERRIPEERERIDGREVLNERVMNESEAVIQAERCLDCYIHTIYDPEKCVFCKGCEEVCPRNCLRFIDVRYIEGESEATRGYLEREKGVALIKDDDLCIRCGLCASICPTGAMTMERILKIKKGEV